MIMKNILFQVSIIFLVPFVQVMAENHPHILIRNDEKSIVIDKIEKEEWANSIFKNLKGHLDVYVKRHKTDPNWILDRYLMNRVPGKRYTHFVADREGTRLVEYKGDAPVPTIRVSSHKRVPITPEGKPYVAPKIEDIVPQDTSMIMNLLNPSTKQFEMVDPQQYVSKINGEINELAYESAVLYWITGDKDYAKFAADILNQWVNAAVWQYPIEGPGRVGFLNIQTLGDENSKPLILAYDFLFPYLKENGYSLENYEKVFERIAWTLSFRGYATNNWFAAESSTLVAAALSLSDKSKRDYYLDFYLKNDTVSNGCGQLSLPSATKIWFTPDGHWKEPGGYHNYPVSKLMEAALMLENNGYEVFKEYPVLLKAAYVMLKYSFPDMTVSAFGDTGRPMQSMECLEIAIKMARKYALPVLPELENAACLFKSRVGYDRSKTGITGLLCYLPQLPEGESSSNNLWKRAEKLDFASCYLQRNGMDVKNGLMFVVQGASYNHNHSNGMSMELYGNGTVMGIDPGNGPTYEHPLHVNYYTQWGAHNTVVAGGNSYSLKPFLGSGGKKEIGAIELLSMEPKVGQDALSDHISYTYTKYFEGFTKTNQERLMSIFRIDEKHGFYVDLYRSSNLACNDYLYHNIGDRVELYDFSGSEIKMSSEVSYPTVGKDYPGFRYFSSVRTTGAYNKGVHAVFSVENLPAGPGYMNMWMPSTSGVSYYTALGLDAKTAISSYRMKKVPLVSIRMEGPADKFPFIAVYEPSSKKDGGVITSVERLSVSSVSTSAAVRVTDNDGGTYIFGNSTKGKAEIKEGMAFIGDLAVFADTKMKKVLYVGNGELVENDDFIVMCNEGVKGDITLEYSDEILLIRSNVPFMIKTKNRRIREKFKLEEEISFDKPVNETFKLNF